VLIKVPSPAEEGRGCQEHILTKSTAVRQFL